MREVFWDRIVNELKSRKITQVNFSRLMGISYDRLRNWIYKNYIPDAITACEMAECLGVTVEFLVRGRSEDMTG